MTCQDFVDYLKSSRDLTEQDTTELVQHWDVCRDCKLAFRAAKHHTEKLASTGELFTRPIDDLSPFFRRIRKVLIDKSSK